MAEIVLETERLVLRTSVASDLPLWLAHLNTPEVMAYLGGPTAPEKVEASIAAMAQLVPGEPPFLIAVRKADGTVLGKCGIARIETPAAPPPLAGALQVGWSLRAEYWGLGYASEAARAVTAHAFERYAAPAIYAQTSERNVPSWRVMERLGMTRLAALDYPDPDYPPEDNPTMVWGLTRDDWLAGRG